MNTRVLRGSAYTRPEAENYIYSKLETQSEHDKKIRQSETQAELNTIPSEPEMLKYRTPISFNFYVEKLTCQYSLMFK